MAMAMRKLSIRDLALADKRVLTRVDFNVPLDPEGRITDNTRIQAAIPTIRYLLEAGAHPILMSHLGRPKGEWKTELSLAPCAQCLSELLCSKVIMAPDAIGPEVEKLAAALQPGEILLLENLRFHRGEEHPDKEPSFVDGLAKLGDCYINDAFGTAHRRHASTVVLAEHFPNQAAAGLLMEKEITFLGETLLEPKRPFIAVVGGAKVSSKLGVLKSLAAKADQLMIGGGMAYTFFKQQGIPIGDSLVEDDLMQETGNLKSSFNNILLPKEVVIANEFRNDAMAETIAIEQGIPQDWMGVDTGAATIQSWKPTLLQAKTIFWNGPLGVFEFPNFAKGTFQMAHILAKAAATTIVGGGDSVAAVNQAGVSDAITHISTGGGATLEFIELGTLPGLDALSDK
jgi:phosphoglycerate kinase